MGRGARAILDLGSDEISTAGKSRAVEQDCTSVPANGHSL